MARIPFRRSRREFDGKSFIGGLPAPTPSGAGGFPPAVHKASHENSGSDEIAVTGLSGLLADSQTPLAHKTSHQDGGADELVVTGLVGLLATAQMPIAHAASHVSGGSDAVKLDDLAAPDDNTDLDVSTTKHGLTPKAPGDATKFLRGDATWAVPNFASGVWTPTLTNVANLDAITAYEGQYLRLGTTVVCSGRVDADPTAPATLTQIGISLPVASDFGAAEDCSGVAFSSAIAAQGAAIRADAANNRAEMAWISGDVTNQPMYYTFTYQVL